MAAPTLLDYAESTYSGTGSPDTTDDLDWSGAGDRIVVLGITEDNGITFTTNPPTISGVTLSTLSGLPTNSTNSCKGYGWSGTASGNSNSTVSAALSGNSAAGLSAWAFSGSDGVVVPTPVVSAALTMSISVSQDSSIVMILGDWNATTDVTVDPDPNGGLVREATSVSGRASFYVVEWHNQAAGTRNYGLQNWTGTGTITKAAVEVQGTASAGVALPSLVIPRGSRR